MAENDIYNSKLRYESFVKRYKDFSLRPEEKPKHGTTKRNTYTRKYYCRNPDNLQYFPKLFKKFEARDTSYIRRMRLLNDFKFICWATEKELSTLDREDIDDIAAQANRRFSSPSTKSDFILDLKYVWKQLFPDRDEKDRIDDTIFPYVVRHLSGKIDKSRKKRRKDILTIDEFEKLVKSFSNDKRMQAYLTLEFESLGRPQETLYAKIGGVELYDNYGKVWISDHGKEGPGFLESIDSFPYVSAWYNEHPLKHDPEAFLFLNLGGFGKHLQLKPLNINKHLREHCKMLGINKKITGYSLKRSGVTYRKYRGDSDTEIQHAARWTSTRPLPTYDYSEHEESFKIQLAKRGLIKHKGIKSLSKTCAFCEQINGIAEEICQNCKRPLDRKKIQEEISKGKDEVKSLREEIDQVKNMLSVVMGQKTEDIARAKGFFGKT